jgi:hypothetical protein
MKTLLLLSLGLLSLAPAHAAEINLVKNPGLDNVVNGKPVGFVVTGPATWRRVGGMDEIAPMGLALPSDQPVSVAQTISVDPAKGKWLTFRFRGLAEEGFAVPEKALAMRIEFFAKNGAEPLDGVTRLIYREIENDRQDLARNGDYGHGGAAAWRSYELEELLPFPQVDSVRISLLSAGGGMPGGGDRFFLVNDFSLVQRDHSLTGRIDPAAAPSGATPANAPDPARLVALGGRWFYLPRPGETLDASPAALAANPLVVTADNADRLFYRSDRMVNPFLNNMTAWLRPGYKDLQGRIVVQDRFVPDNVVLTFKGDGFLTLHAHNIPNHPTARFPDTFGTQGYNFSYIQELDKTYRLPLEPVLNPHAVVMDAHDRNDALQMGAIGVAVNGVVFYNPFDAGLQDASSIMDRCCGHPSPDNRYHYHKYPICVNTPFADKGDAPSPVIGFAFDGLPIYGPYSQKDVLAEDDTDHPLNAFNAVYDDIRGWHYHVTPGKFPYIIGGYFAKVETSNIDRAPVRPRGGGNMGFPALGGDGP